MLFKKVSSFAFQRLTILATMGVVFGSLLMTSSWAMDGDDTSATKSLVKSRDPSVNIEDLNETYYSAPDSFETDRLICIRIGDKEEELASYQLVFDDNPEPPAWSVNQYKSKEIAEDVLNLKEEFGVYNIFSSFSDYNIYLKANEETEDTDTEDTLIGRFGLRHRRPSDDRLELSDYISSLYRGKGYGKEANKGFIEHVILPGVGKPFIMIGTNDDSILPECEDTPQGKVLWAYNKLTFPCKRSNFKGIEGVIDLENTASLAVSLASGYFPILVNRFFMGPEIIVYVPPLHNKWMNPIDMQNLKNLSIAWKDSKSHLQNDSLSLEERNILE